MSDKHKQATTTGWKRPSEILTCKRCGLERSRGGNSAALCSDCRLVLTSAEKALWAA